MYFSRYMYSIYFPNYENLKSFLETLTPYNQILIFEEQLCKLSNGFLYLILTSARYNARPNQLNDK
jgi:hypothetical protein